MQELNHETIKKLFDCYEVFDVVPMTIRTRKICKIDIKLSEKELYDRLLKLFSEENVDWHLIASVEEDTLENFTLEGLKIDFALVERNLNIAFLFSLEARYVDYLKEIFLFFFGKGWEGQREIYVSVDEDILNNIRLLVRQRGYDIVLNYLLKVGNPYSEAYQVGVYETFVKNRYS